MKMTDGAGVCEFTIAKDFYFHSEVPCSLEPDTIRYAVCRGFKKNWILCKSCVYASWQSRVSSSRARKRRYHTYIVPSAIFELPGKWAKVMVLVEAAGITVECLYLLREFPALHQSEDSQKGM